MWQCESVSPGTTVAPCRSTMRVLSFANFLASVIRADENDPIFSHRDGFRMRLSFIECVDISVEENQIDILRAVKTRTKSE